MFIEESMMRSFFSPDKNSPGKKKSTVLSSYISSLSFYHDIPRNEAEAELCRYKEFYPSSLLYLLRPSSREGNIAFSCINPDGEISHIAIVIKNDACYYRDDFLVKDIHFVLRDLIIVLIYVKLALIPVAKLEDIFPQFHEFQKNPNASLPINKETGDTAVSTLLFNPDNYDFGRILFNYCHTFLSQTQFENKLNTQEKNGFLIYAQEQADFDNRILHLLAYDHNKNSFEKLDIHFQQSNSPSHKTRWLLKRNDELLASFNSFEDLTNELKKDSVMVEPQGLQVKQAVRSSYHPS
jgi:hypothetical protein